MQQRKELRYTFADEQKHLPVRRMIRFNEEIWRNGKQRKNRTNPLSPNGGLKETAGNKTIEQADKKTVVGNEALRKILPLRRSGPGKNFLAKLAIIVFCRFFQNVRNLRRADRRIGVNK